MDPCSPFYLLHFFTHIQVVQLTNRYYSAHRADLIKRLPISAFTVPHPPAKMTTYSPHIRLFSLQMTWMYELKAPSPFLPFQRIGCLNSKHSPPPLPSQSVGCMVGCMNSCLSPPLCLCRGPPVTCDRQLGGLDRTADRPSLRPYRLHVVLLPAQPTQLRRGNRLLRAGAHHAEAGDGGVSGDIARRG